MASWGIESMKIITQSEDELQGNYRGIEVSMERTKKGFYVKLWNPEGGYEDEGELSNGVTRPDIEDALEVVKWRIDDHLDKI